MPTYIVTGANRGLGLEFVRQLAKSKENVIIATSRSKENDLGDLKSMSSKLPILQCDTSKVGSIETFTSDVKRTLDGKKVDYLINNAGVNSVPEQDSLSIGAEDLQREVLINVVGTAKVTELLLKADLLADNVRILNMTSGLGSMEHSTNMTPRKCATYSISKAGVNMLTVHQAYDIQQRLSDCIIICMDPGWVKTRMGGEGAVLEPEESISGMLKCLHGLVKEDTGKSYTYTGETVPW